MFIVDTSDTYFLDRIYEDIDELCFRYRGILSKSVIGKSVEGRNIVALRISGWKAEILRCAQNDEETKAQNDEETKAQNDEGTKAQNDKKTRGQNDDKMKGRSRERPTVLFVGGIHAREDFSVMLCMKMIEQYCFYYSGGKMFDGLDVKNIIDNADMYFVPVANPDGLNIVHNGIHASLNYEKLKDMKIWGEDYTYWKANANGVDLNKNFDDGNWDIRACVPGTDVPCSERFKGYEANSEPETKALINFCNENNFSLMITYHCSGNCTFWADGGTHHMFNGLDEKIMDELNERFIYRKTKVSADPKIYGCGFENWFRKRMKRPAFCVELSPFVEGGKQHPDYMFEDLVWQHGKNTGLFFAEKAIEVYNEVKGDAEKYAALTE